MSRWIRLRVGALSVLVLGIGLGLGIAIERYRARARAASITTAQVFENVLAAIRTGYVDSLTEEELYAKAAKGVVSTLGDPYSAFLGPAEYSRYRDLLSGRGRSLGLDLTTGLTGLRVASVAARGPADRLGIEAGDYLLAIDGHPVTTLPPDRAAALLRAGGDSIRVRYRGPGDTIAVETALVPADVRLPVITPPVSLTDSIGYLAMGSLSSHASRELRAVLAQIHAERIGGLLLDLRGNGGGPLNEALGVADLLLAPGQRIGAVSKRRTLWSTYIAGEPYHYPALRLVILVDRRTASSAEIIAAALRDNDRALLVGERTFGKGLIQTTIPLGDSAALRLTTGRWQGPGGRLIAGGLTPDSTVTVPPREALLRRALQRQPESLAVALERVVGELDSSRTRGAAIDSLRLSPAERDRLSALMRPAGITLSRRLMTRHQQLFDREARRVAAELSGDRNRAARYGLLSDPVVTAALQLVGRAR
jgi:carboxyl-terminal processing protease